MPKARPFQDRGRHLTLPAFFDTLTHAKKSGKSGLLPFPAQPVRPADGPKGVPEMTLDVMLNEREWRKEHRPGWLLLVSAAAIYAATLFLYHYEMQFSLTDLAVHANIAADFDFTDLHSITSRLAYPLWHLMTSCVYQLGLPIEWAAPVICSLCKVLTFVLTQRVLVGLCRGKVKENTLTLAAVLVNVVTAVFIPGVNDRVYRGFGYTIGSPNVWHNPTQQAVLVSALMVLPLLCHCWYEFERRYPEEGEKTLLPWGEVILLAVFLMGSLACKPTFMQALLPAAFVMFLVELCRRPRCWRYFGQIVLAFVPAVAYFLLQYLYYTGVVVEYTSGVEFGVTLDSILSMLRSTVMMSVFPLYAIVCCYKKGMFKDRMLVLALLMVFFSLLEGMAFRETGLREGHGNFTWAANSSSFVLWVVMAGIFLREFVSGLKAKTLSSGRKAAYAVGFALMGWHAASGVYYLYFLLSTGNAF